MEADACHKYSPSLSSKIDADAPNPSSESAKILVQSATSSRMKADDSTSWQSYGDDDTRLEGYRS